MTKFEYRVHTVRAPLAEQLGRTIEKELNELGAQGWELMTCAIQTHSALCVLKRLS